MPDNPRRDPVQDFADRIIAELENGVKPWVRPWDPEKAGGPQAPFNPITGKRYHGINVLILGMDMRAFQRGDPRWMTYQQSQEKEWQIRKGEKATTIFFTKPYEVENDDAEDGKKTIRVLKHYAVFHASQIDGIPGYKAPSVEEAPWTRPEAPETATRFDVSRMTRRHHNTERELLMLNRPVDPQLAREAKAIVALAFRNGPIEKVHAGKLCPTCSAGPEYSRITDDEMKAIMKSAVNRMYTLLRLKSGDQDGYERQIAFGSRYVTRWDEPEEPRA